MTESWIECSDCQKWRRVVGLEERWNADDARWCVAARACAPQASSGQSGDLTSSCALLRRCTDNTDLARNRCSVPAEATDEEIDRRLAQQPAPDDGGDAGGGEAPVWRFVHRNFFTHRPPKQARRSLLRVWRAER